MTTVEQRRSAFESYLCELLTLQPRPQELNAFLDINKHVWGGADQPNALAAVAAAGGGGGIGSGASTGNGALRASLGPTGPGSAQAQADFIARLREGNVGLDDFELLRVLGKGSFGKVFLVRLLATGSVYAMKVLKKSEVVRRRQVEHTRAERRIMGGIEHPFVVALRFAFQTADKLYMVTDYW